MADVFLSIRGEVKSKGSRAVITRKERREVSLTIWSKREFAPPPSPHRAPPRLQLTSTYETRTGRYVVSLEATVLRYLFSTFVPDVLSLLPLHVLVGGELPQERRFASVLSKLLKLPRGYVATCRVYSRAKKRLGHYLRHLSVFVLTTTTVFVMTHWLACSWWTFVDLQSARRSYRREGEGGRGGRRERERGPS